MSHITTIDTLQFSNRMRKAGFGQKAADELAEAIKEIQTQSCENTVTKQDITNMEESRKLEIVDFRKEVKRDISDLKRELKQDISNLRIELKQDISDLREETKWEMAGLKQDISDLRKETRQDIADLRKETKQDIADLRSHDISDLNNKIEILRKDMQIIENRVVMKLGSLTAVGVAILAALIKL